MNDKRIFRNARNNTQREIANAYLYIFIHWLLRVGSNYTRYLQDRTPRSHFKFKSNLMHAIYMMHSTERIHWSHL